MNLPDWSPNNLVAVAPILDDWAAYYGLPRSIVYGLVSQESRFNPNAIGDAGRAHGLTQIWFTTAQGLGYTGNDAGLQDPNVNVQFGLQYLKAMLDRFGSMDAALSAYNGGLHSGVITNQSYVDAVNGRAAYFDALWSSADDGSTPPDDTGGDGTNGSGIATALALLVGAFGLLKYTRVL